MVTRWIPAAAASLTAGLLLGACSVMNPPPVPPPPPRPSVLAGPAYATAVAYLAAHPRHVARGMTYGILIADPKPCNICVNGDIWQGTVVVAGGRVEHVSSDEDDSMAQLVSPGDEFLLPAGGPVDTAEEGPPAGSSPARLLVAGAVAVP